MKAEQTKLVKDQMGKAKHRFGAMFFPGSETAKCENTMDGKPCGNIITPTTLSVFMFPEEFKFHTIFVCKFCAASLLVQFNYSNKN